MPSKPETNLIHRVHKHLHPVVYREKMHNPYSSGTPDVYYEGNESILWVEYKYWNRRFTDFSFDQILRQMCTPHQQRWLDRADRNGVPVAVIVGFNDKLIGVATPASRSEVAGSSARETARALEEMTCTHSTLNDISQKT